MRTYTYIQKITTRVKRIKTKLFYGHLSFLILFFLVASPAISQLYTVSGPNAAAITPIVTNFRTALGTLNPNVPGPLPPGRREINWDGVPDALSAPNNLPANFFNVNSPRGVVFSTPGTGFQVSANAGIAPVEFGNIDPSYPALFAPFSAQRLFTPLGSNIMDINFFIPGTNIPALTRGFGAVFSDVDLASITRIQAFDKNGTQLFNFDAQAFSGNETFSFVGFDYGVPIIARVRITTGNNALGAGITEVLPTRDLVVMDDFIYGEPVNVSPCTLTCPANITVSNTTGQCGAVVNYAAPTTSGVCGIVTATPASGSFFAVGNTTVNVSSTSGQRCSFTVRVNDAQAPSITSCPVVSPFCVNSTGNYTIPALTATDNCPGLTVSYSISGATTRTGTGTNASGAFNPGTSIINWTARDAAGNTSTCQTTVTVNVGPTVTIPDAFALPSGVAANTVYIGYEPASSITLTANASGGTPPYSYTWSTGSHASSITVSPTVTTTYTVTVTDANGCTGTASKTIFVVDVRCGNKLDKVQVCHVPPGNPSNAHGICISANAVPAHLAKGSYLGECINATNTITSKGISGKGIYKIEQNVERLTVQTISNPAPAYFTLVTRSNNPNAIQLRVFNVLGKVVEVRNNVAANSTLQLGQNYRPGMYYAEVVQGKERVILKLIKGSK